jgi:hypothetical protein
MNNFTHRRDTENAEINLYWTEYKIFSSSANFVARAERVVKNIVNNSFICTAHLGPPAKLLI